MPTFWPAALAFFRANSWHNNRHLLSDLVKKKAYLTCKNQLRSSLSSVYVTHTCVGTGLIHNTILLTVLHYVKVCVLVSLWKLLHETSQLEGSGARRKNHGYGSFFCFCFSCHHFFKAVKFHATAFTFLYTYAHNKQCKTSAMHRVPRRQTWLLLIQLTVGATSEMYVISAMADRETPNPATNRPRTCITCTEQTGYVRI